jgi:EamA domain-containing membrane protein RarD
MREVTVNVHHHAARSLRMGVLAILQGVAAIVLVCTAVTVLSCRAQGSL